MRFRAATLCNGSGPPEPGWPRSGRMARLAAAAEHEMRNSCKDPMDRLMVDAGGCGTAVSAEGARGAVPTNRAASLSDCLAADAGGWGTTVSVEGARGAISTNRATTLCDRLVLDAGRTGGGGGTWRRSDNSRGGPCNCQGATICVLGERWIVGQYRK